MPLPRVVVGEVALHQGGGAVVPRGEAGAVLVARMAAIITLEVPGDMVAPMQGHTEVGGPMLGGHILGLHLGVLERVATAVSPREGLATLIRDIR